MADMLRASLFVGVTTGEVQMVKDALNLAIADAGGKSDPFVEVSLSQLGREAHLGRAGLGLVPGPDPADLDAALHVRRRRCCITQQWCADGHFGATAGTDVAARRGARHAMCA